MPCRGGVAPRVSASQVMGYISCMPALAMEISSSMPRPVRSLSRTPARMAKAASSPVAESMTGNPVLMGGSPSLPAM